MEILQKPTTPKHLSAMFFDGVIATDGDYSLITYQDGEIVYDDKLYIGAETKDLIGLIEDDDIDDEIIVDIHVDKFFGIKYNDVVIEEYLFIDYDEAILGFEDFLAKL